MNKTTVSIFLLALMVVLLGVIDFMTAKPPAHVVVGLDTSDSVKRDCDGLSASIKALIAKSEFRRGSTVTLLGIGLGPAQPQPARLFGQPIPFGSGAVLGSDAAAQEVARQNYVSQIQAACEGAPKSPSSPILEMVRASVSHLHTRGCGEKRACFAEFQTDLREDVDVTMRTAIERAARREPSQTESATLDPIRNDRVSISFCGTGQAKALRAKGPSLQGLQQIWLRQFAHPELVSFRPYCGQ